jgi:predicted phage tail protein
LDEQRFALQAIGDRCRPPTHRSPIALEFLTATEFFAVSSFDCAASPLGALRVWPLVRECGHSSAGHPIDRHARTLPTTRTWGLPSVMMRTVFLYGALAGTLPEQYREDGRARIRLDVRSAGQACRLLAVQLPEFDRVLQAGAFKVRLGADGKIHRTLRDGESEVRLGRKNELHIVPAAGFAWTGENRSLGKVILGVALLGAGIAGGILAAPAGATFGAAMGAEAAFGISYGSIALTGASMALTGLAQVLAPNPSVGRYEQREAPEDRPNWLFTGAVNSVNQGAAVPWVYGRDVLCSSVVLSGAIVDEQIGPGVPEPEIDGMVATAQSAAAGEIVLAKGKKATYRPPEESPDSLQSKSTARVRDLWGYGELELVDGLHSFLLDDTPVQNDDDSSNFGDFKLTWRSGLPDQTAIPGADAQESYEPINADATFDAPVIRTIANADANAARATVRLNEGLWRQDTSGDIRPHTVDYELAVRASGGDWVVQHNIHLEGKAQAGYQVNYRLELPEGGNPWDVRLRRITPDSNASTARNKISLAAITTLIEVRQTYPFWAVSQAEIDSKAFTGIPRRSARLRRVDVQIPSNYDPETRTYDGIWDGTFKLGCTDNPAWAPYDLLTNDLFGSGGDIVEELIFKESLYAAAQYCDELVSDGRDGTEPRFTFNAQLTTREPAYDVLNAIAGRFRAMIYWSAGAVYFSQDRPKTARRLITNANALKGGFKYQRASKKTWRSVAKVTWDNSKNGEPAAITMAIDRDMMRRIGHEEIDVYAWGCNSEGQAQRIGLAALYDNNYANKLVQWGAGFDQFDLNPGDIVEISNRARIGARFGGKLVGYDDEAWTVTLDAPVTLEAGESYQIALAGRDNLPVRRDIVNYPGTYTVLQLAEALPDPPPIFGAIWTISATNLPPQEFLILSNDIAEKHQCRLIASLHNPDKYAWIENGVKLDHIPTTILPTGKLKAPTNLTVSERLYQAGPAVSNKALLSWEAADDVRVRGYEVQVKGPEDGAYTALGPAGTGLTREMKDFAPGAYTFQVRAYAEFGRRSDWVPLEASLLALQQGFADVERFRVSLSGGKAQFTWKMLADLRQPPYQIRFMPVQSGAEWNQATIKAETVYGSQVDLPAQAGTYLIKAKTAYAESQNATTVIMPAVPDDFNVVETIDEHPGWAGDKILVIVDGSDLVLPAGSTGIGVYTAAGPYFDLGGVFSARLTAHVLASAADTEDVMANWTTLAALATLSGVNPDQWRIRAQIRTTDDDPNASPIWTEWEDLLAGQYTFRGLDRRLLLEADGQEIEIRVAEWSTIVDMQDRTIPFEDVETGAVATALTFDPPLKVLRLLLITPQDGLAGDELDVISKSATGASFIIRNGGTPVARTVDVAAIGYGIGV